MTHVGHRYNDDSFYEIATDFTADIFCGECISKDIKDTQEGRLVGDEKFEHFMVVGTVNDSEAVQCGSCNKQSWAYEELGEDEDD